MTVFWDKIKKNIINSLNEAIDKTEEVTSVGRTKLEILQLEHRLDEQYTELGKFIYTNFKSFSSVLKDNEKAVELKKAIDHLEKELGKKERELGRIREEDGINFD
jgi:hypothetical protein